ncbi:MMPL family transporter [Halosquirtibacter xylanolyticus]|uniref:efflux RND transporter permease subunit n=1 Tax=Halosquirtibacter xylanolyticus TaxID=3374599 RepID=UPI00374902A7|nr:MMPL family transporter [Prolixibacteraceae bacterium]
MWKRIARFILKNRVLLSVLLLLMTAFMGYQGRNIQLSYEYAALLPEKDSVYQENQRFIETFGAGSDVIVVGVKDSMFYDIEHLSYWRNMCSELEKVPGVLGTLSMGDVYTLDKNKEKKSFEIHKIFPKDLTSQEEVDSLSNIANSLPFFKGQLYNDTTHVYMLAITVDKAVMASPEREVMVTDIVKVCHQYEAKTGKKLHYSGMPYIRVMTSQQIKKEFFLFILFALAVVVLILFIFFKTVRQVIFPLLVVTTGVIWTVGTMSLLGYKITLLTGMIPPLLIVIGVPNCIFLINKYHNEYISHGNKMKALQRTIIKIGNATLLTNITTASGFATFLVTSSDILKEFGLVASLNIISIFMISLIIIPVGFSFMGPPRPKDTRHLNRKAMNGVIDRLVIITLNYRKQVYIASAVILCIGIFGISKIKSTGYMVDDIQTDNPIYVDLKFFESNFKGLMPLEIAVETKKKGNIISGSTLAKIDKFERTLQKMPELSKPVSIVPLFKFAKQAYYNGSEKFYKLPSNYERSFILSYAQGGGGDESRIHAFMDESRSKARISFRVKDIGTDRMLELEQKVDSTALKYFPKDKFNVTVTGSSVVFTKGTQYLVRSLFQSLGLAILLISIFMALMFNSRRMVILSLIPNMIPLVVTAAIMGYFNIPIKASTILVFSIAFGISVDDTIHFLAKYRQELKYTNWNIGQSVILALRETGVSMIYTSLVLFFGFGIFSFSSFGGTVALGILVSLTLMVALFSNLILLPSLLMGLQSFATTKYFDEPLLDIFDEEMDIEFDLLEIKKIEEPLDKKENQ